MTHTVYRYRLTITDEQTVSMPEGAVILSVARRDYPQLPMLGVGGDEPLDMWALVDPDAPVRPRRIRIAGTGHPLDDVDQLEFLGTVQVVQGQLVFHVFEALENLEDQSASP